MSRRDWVMLLLVLFVLMFQVVYWTGYLRMPQSVISSSPMFADCITTNTSQRREEDQEATTEIIVPYKRDMTPRFRLLRNHSRQSNYKTILCSEYFSRGDDGGWYEALKDTLANNANYDKDILFIWLIQGKSNSTFDRTVPDDMNFVVYQTDEVQFGPAFSLLSHLYGHNQETNLIYRNFDVSIHNLDFLSSCSFQDNFFVVSRQDQTGQMMTCNGYMNIGSFDTYIWRGRDPKLIDAFQTLNYEPYFIGGENFLADIIMELGKHEIINLCPAMTSIHIHDKTGVERKNYDRYRIGGSMIPKSIEEYPGVCKDFQTQNH